NTTSELDRSGASAQAELVSGRDSLTMFSSMKIFKLRIADCGLRILDTSVSPVFRKPQPAIRNVSGFTLLEIIIVITILSVLTAAAIPMVRNTVRREREAELRLALRQLRQAIDRYKLYHDQSNGSAIPIEWKTQSGYPKELKVLVEGFIPANVVGLSEN